MNKSEQYEYFQSLIKTCDKLEKAFSKDKTTDAIISDITDPDSKASVIQNQGNPTSTSMTKCSNMLKSDHKKGDRVVHDVHGAGTVKESLGDGNHLVNFDNANPKEGPKQVHSSNFKQKEFKKSDEKGVHNSYMKPGESLAGELTREHAKNPKSIVGEANKDVAVNQHKQKLSELKEIKPDLPKSEQNTGNATLNKFKRFVKKKNKQKQS